MSIAYSYEIISVDATARVMEVVYTSEGRQTMHVSARLPFEGETLEAVIDMFSPVAYWMERELPVVVPQIGASGTVAPASQQDDGEQTQNRPIRVTLLDL